MTRNRARAVQELRRSNAAGTHGHRPTRAQQLADALADWADEQIPDAVVDAVFDALDPDEDISRRTEEEAADIRTALTAAARHLIYTTSTEGATEMPSDPMFDGPPMKWCLSCGNLYLECECDDPRAGTFEELLALDPDGAR